MVPPPRALKRSCAGEISFAAWFQFAVVVFILPGFMPQKHPLNSLARLGLQKCEQADTVGGARLHES